MAAYRCRKCGECFQAEGDEPTHEKCGGKGYPRNCLSTEVYIWSE